MNEINWTWSKTCYVMVTSKIKPTQSITFYGTIWVEAYVCNRLTDIWTNSISVLYPSLSSRIGCYHVVLLLFVLRHFCYVLHLGLMHLFVTALLSIEMYVYPDGMQTLWCCSAKQKSDLDIIASFVDQTEITSGRLQSVDIISNFTMIFVFHPFTLGMSCTVYKIVAEPGFYGWNRKPRRVIKFATYLRDFAFITSATFQ